ncbi:hypothetical protein E6C27_scaffold35G00130 [Cucumis melo var. makuwa]|uniref:Uncharacterized protein n=1 Tax=Cucumis melo var. makuwa TaxID=1194695 RepID=A0A5A7TGK8_CUCMM|nr:hypothetical protein E6C27_scaffold35G00130 [Cucumis melo var. makuwa]
MNPSTSFNQPLPKIPRIKMILACNPLRRLRLLQEIINSSSFDKSIFKHNATTAVTCANASPSLSLVVPTNKCEETLASRRRHRPSLLRQSTPSTVCHRTTEPIATQLSRCPKSSVSSADNLRGSESTRVSPADFFRQLPPRNQSSPVARSTHLRTPRVGHRTREAQYRRTFVTRATQSYPTTSPLCVNPSDPHPPASSRTCAAFAPLAEPHPSASSRTRAVPTFVPSRVASSAFKTSRLQPSSRVNFCLSIRADSCFLAEPICLSLSRQPSPVLCTYFGSLDQLNCTVKDFSSNPTTNQYVLGALSGHRRPDSVPTGAHVARVWERASRGRGKGKGKLARDQK